MGDSFLAAQCSGFGPGIGGILGDNSKKINQAASSATIASDECRHASQLRLCYAKDQSDCGDFRGCETRAGVMSDLLNLAMLICASLASMAFGIFAAYYILRLGFALMRLQPQAAVKPKTSPEMAGVS
jgi:hypothetical protein